MIILILIILLFFNIYLKQIKSSFYTALILFVLVINEIYFSKIEKFDSSTVKESTSETEYRFDYDFKQHMNKEMCIFDEQQNIITTNKPINSKCHKIFNRKSCDMYRECEYDTEYNKCNEKSICNNINTQPLKCHYMDNKEICNILAPQIPNCEMYKNKNKCDEKKDEDGTKFCYWNKNKNKCKYKPNTCVRLEEEDCLNNCKWDYYNDFYNAEPNSETNTKQCHSLYLLNLNYKEFIDKEITVSNLDDISEEIKKYYNISSNKKQTPQFYGIQKKKSGYKIIFLTCDNLSTLSISAKRSNTECLNGNKYLGNDDTIMIYEKKGQCNTKSKCEWKFNEQNEKKCLIFSDKRNCLENPDCYYDKDTCLPKGFCKRKTNTRDGRRPIDNPSPTNHCSNSVSEDACINKSGCEFVNNICQPMNTQPQL